MRPQHVGCDQRVGQVDRRARRERSDQEFDQAHRARIGLQQVPVAVDRHGRKRLLLRQHEIERASHLAQFGSGKVGLPPDRRKARRDQQRIVLAQRHIERGRKPHHHSRLGDARPNSRKLRWRCEISVRPARSSCDRPRCRRHQRRLDAKSFCRDMSTCQVVAQTMLSGNMPYAARGETQEMSVSEWIGVAIALVSSCLGGTAAAITRYLVGNADPITLAILRWGIGFACLLPTALLLG